MTDTTPCPDCQVAVGQPHDHGCDVARCLATGGQRLSCELADDWGEQHDSCGQDVWTGHWPGTVECAEFGWWVQDRCGEGLGFTPCAPNAPGAIEDLNRLYYDARWDRAAERWVLR
jgi:hypothetical protein